MRLLAGLAAAAVLYAGDLPRIYFTKSFPGSVPAYVSIQVDKSGLGEFNDSPGNEQPPLKFRLAPAESEAIFALAAKVGYFARPLESGLKVAFTGSKVFRYVDGATNHEVKFNYTQDSDGMLLLDWFERIAETSMHGINIERTAKFDRLGLDKALLQLQVSVDRHRLAGASQLLPILDRIAKTTSAFNRVQERAASIAETIRAGDARKE